MSKFKTTFSPIRLMKSFSYAFKGLRYVLFNEKNMHIHCFAAFVVFILGLCLGLSTIEWCLISIVIGMVLAAEMFNTSIELLTNLVSPDYHELAGKTKDVAAGAVVIVSLCALIVGLLIFTPKIYHFISSISIF